jgi:hypothetical protein
MRVSFRMFVFSLASASAPRDCPRLFLPRGQSRRRRRQSVTNRKKSKKNQKRRSQMTTGRSCSLKVKTITNGNPTAAIAVQWYSSSCDIIYLTTVRVSRLLMPVVEDPSGNGCPLHETATMCLLSNSACGLPTFHRLIRHVCRRMSQQTKTKTKTNGVRRKPPNQSSLS